jgi:hypothetical protein
MYNFHYCKKCIIVLLLSLCISLMLASISTSAQVIERDESRTSYMLDYLYNPSNKTLPPKYSLAGNMIAQSEVRTAPQSRKSGYYGTKDWLALIVVYAWLSGINGETGTGDNVADVDMSFSDIWKNFDVGGQAHIEFWWKRLLLFADSTYIVTTEDNSQTTVIGALKSSLKTKFFLFDLATGYRVAQIPLGSNMKTNNFKSWPSLNVDLYAGGRIFNVDTKLKLKLDSPIAPLKTNIKDENTWFDFIMGTRLLYYATENLSLAIKTDIGGFGFGFSSDIDWNFATNVAYELPWWGITTYAGYRVLYVDYKDGSGDNRFVYNIWQTGPQLGVGVRF